MQFLKKAIKALGLIEEKKQKAFNEKTYPCSISPIKYVFHKESDSLDLVVVFSAFPALNSGARYNYMRSLKDVRANKLFILDDFGSDLRGSYYLGKGGELQIQEAVVSLIQSIKSANNIRRMIFAGSSKGGYAAINFSSFFGDTHVIAGGPQYLLGEYLKIPGHSHILEYITGDSTSESVDSLNKFSREILSKPLSSTCHYDVFCSKTDSMHALHVTSLVSDLKSNNIRFVHTEGAYSTHDDLAVAFPEFLNKTVKSILNEKVVRFETEAATI